MNVAFNGYDEKVITFACDDTVGAGSLVKLSGNGTVTACTDGDVFIGAATGVRGGYCGVQTGGYARIPVSGSVLVGFQKLSAADDGKVKVNAAAGRELLVLDVIDGSAGILL